MESASAQGIAPSAIHQEDVDGDGNPDITTIDVQNDAFSGQIMVIDSSDDMVWSEHWSTATDFDDDTWIYDSGRDGTAQLIIEFENDLSRTVARLYDDFDGDGQVSYELAGKRLTITEPGFAPLIISVEGEWILPGGGLNWNLHVTADGPRPEFSFTYNLSTPWKNFLLPDGVPDSDLQFFDNNQDGLPEYGVWRLLAIAPRDWTGVTGRTFVVANMGRTVPVLRHEPFYWPLLAYGPISEDSLSVEPIKGYFDAAPFLLIDWEGARIESFRFPGYPIENGFHINSQAASSLGQVNYVNFEIMQAYYDLAADQDGYPELHIRHRYFGPDDINGWSMDSPINEIRYSWSVSNDNELSWDYKIGLAGRHLIEDVLPIPNISFQTISFEKHPSWILTGDWDYATFVAAESHPYLSSEGIYAWAPVESPLYNDVRGLSEYLSGYLETSAIAAAFSDINVGLRGELSTVPLSELRLYLSPVDQRLHLKWAEHGIWRLDDEQLIRVANLNSDETIDVWSRETLPAPVEEDDRTQALDESGSLQMPDELGNESGEATAPPEVIETLYALHGHLLHTNDGGVTFVQSDYEPILLETLPPSNHDSWETHRALLAPYEDQRRDPTNLRGWLDTFPGPRFEIAGASLQNVRITDDGFRFEINVSSDYRVLGFDFIGLADLVPGQYVVSYANEAFGIERLTPPDLDLILKAPQELHVGQTQRLLVQLANRGLQDAPGLALSGKAEKGDEVVDIVGGDVNALSGDTARLILDWQPDLEGEWMVTLNVVDAEGEVVAELSQLVVVAPPSSMLSLQVPAGAGRDTSLLPWALMLGLLGLVAGVAAVSSWRSDIDSVNR